MNNELNLLTQISNLFSKVDESSDFVTDLESALKEIIKADELNIYIYDKTTHSLRDFAKSWVIIDENDNDNTSNNLYNAFNKFNAYKFFFNNQGINDITQKLTPAKSNVILYPLIQREKPFGILELKFSDIELSEKFLTILQILCTQISLFIENKILYDRMEINIKFHEAMKNIAKIIETQYELNYIIPLIGEMIDKFIQEHLIYIFLKKESTSKFELIWPLACRDKKILTGLNQISLETKYFLTDNDKIGFFPITSESEVLGCIVAHSNIDKLNIREIEYLNQLTQQASSTINRANIYAEVLKHATLDALTGINNRHQFETRLKQETSMAIRQNLPLCAIMLDIDFFKKVNDTYGHAVGDVVLKEVAHTITGQLRESDIPCRYGGEEFAILLPFTKIEEACGVAQRLRAAVEQKNIDISKISEKEFINVTISIGVSEFDKQCSAQDLYMKADKALYQAKTHGRNKVVIYRDEQ